MIRSAGNCIGAAGGEGEEEQTFSVSPHCRVLGVRTPQALYTLTRLRNGSSRCSQYPGHQWGQESCGILWGMSCSSATLGWDVLEKRQDPSPPLTLSYLLGHIPLPLWPHTPGMAGAASLPHHVIHSSSSSSLLPTAPVVWAKTSLPTSTPSGWVLYPSGRELWLPSPHSPRSPRSAVSRLQTLPSCQHPPRPGPVGFWGAGTEREHRDPHITALGGE